MRTARLVALCVIGLLCLVSPQPMLAGGGATTLYGASNDLGNGLFGTVNQSTGVFTQTGATPTGLQMPSLACNAQQTLYGAENRNPVSPMTSVTGSGRCGFLMQVNPANGSSVQNFGFITLNGSPNTCMRMSDFDFNPANGVLYGVGPASSSRDGLFTISLTTPPVATMVGLLDPLCQSNCLSRGGLAFRDDGRLFLVSVDADLAQLNPVDATVIGSVTALSVSCADSATFRNSDDVLFIGECDGSTLSTVDESTGQATLLTSDPGEDLGSLAFCGDRGGIVGGVTPTPTVPGPTSTPTATRTPTAQSGAAPVDVPTMSGLATAVFGLLLAAVALLSILRLRS
jgi:hypothetical protein